MNKIILVIVSMGILLLAVVMTAGVYFWYVSQQPLYQPGMVRAGENLRAPLTPAQPTDNPHFWQVETDIQLYHFTQGNGRNILIIHGGPGLPYTEPWPGLAPLADQYQFHYYDQRGSGQSSRPIQTVTSKNYLANLKTVDHTLGIGAQLADIERIRQTLDQDKLILIGHSFGGFLASLYAAEFPEHVEALILIAPANVLVMPQADDGLFEAVHGRLPTEMQADYEAYLADYLNFRDIFTKSDAQLSTLNGEFVTYYQAAMQTPLLESGKPGGWMVQALYLSMGRRHDYRDALRTVNSPVLIIHGANDLQSEAASRLYADAFPQAEFYVMPDVTHVPFYEQPDAFAQVIGDFLLSLP